MSEMEYWKGKAVPVSMDTDLETTAKNICAKHEWEMDKYYSSWVEVIEDLGYRKYVVVDDKIYEIVNPVEFDNYGFIDGTLNEDESIDFIMGWYNGGASFSEVCEQAIKQAKNG